MKRFFLFALALCAALPLWALQCGQKAVELPNLNYLTGARRQVAVPLNVNCLRAVTFVHTYGRGAQETITMLKAWNKTYGNRLQQIVITPDPESDAAALLPLLKQSGISFAVDSRCRITMQYMAGSLLYPKSFVIDPKGKVIWCGQTVDMGEMLQEYFTGKFDAAAAEKISPMLDELQTLLRESSERKMKALTDQIFAISPAHPGALRMRLFALENSNRIPQAWTLISERISAAPGSARLYFTAVDFMGRYTPFKSNFVRILSSFDRNVKDMDSRCMMAWELLNRFSYDLKALEYADLLLGKIPPAKVELRRVWFAARAQTAYLAGDVSKAIRYQKQALPPGRSSSPMLEYLTGVEKLRKRLP
ncbi:MAG: hypothetical protein E7048_05260 [Lentisphaerae bacterium]|nr:hypothetical protein [Lentisphaerota bacterium]MBR2873143.1 hypothetical protein [Lentisphaeria bacterium]